MESCEVTSYCSDLEQQVYFSGIPTAMNTLCGEKEHAGIAISGTRYI